MADIQPLSYGEVRDLYDTLRTRMPAVQGMDLPTFSRSMNEMVGVPMFDAGLNDSWLKQASNAIDRALRPVSRPMGAGFSEIAKLAGAPSLAPMAQQMGEFLPRGMIETILPFSKLKWAGRGLGGLLAGVRTYTDTDSGAAGAVQGAFTAVLPEFAKAGARAATAPLSKLFYEAPTAKLGAKTVTGAIPKTQSGMAGMLERQAERAGMNLGFLVNQELALQGVYKVMGQGPVSYDSKHLTELAVSQAPFAILDVMRAIPRPKAGLARSPLEERQAQKMIRAQAEVANYHKTLETEVEDVVQTELPKVEAAKLAGLSRYFDNTLLGAMRRNVGGVVDMRGFETLRTKEGKQRPLTTVEKQLLDEKVESLIQRGVLMREGGTLKVTGKIDVETAFAQDVQKMFDLGETLGEALPGMERKNMYVPGVPGRTHAELQHPSPVGQYPRPFEYSDLSPEALASGATDINSVVRGVVPKELLKVAPATPGEPIPAPKTAAEALPYLGKVWQLLKNEGDRLGRLSKEHFKAESSVSGWYVGGEKSELPPPIRALYDQVEKQILARFGVESPAQLEALAASEPGREISLATRPEVDPRPNLENFVRQTKALLGLGEEASTVLQPVPPTQAERYAYVKKLIRAVTTMVERATSAKLTPLGKEMASMTEGVKLGKELEEAKAQLKLAGRHEQINKLLVMMHDDYNAAVEYLHGQLGVLKPVEIAERFYALQMKRLKNLVAVHELAKAPFEQSVEEVLKAQEAIMVQGRGVARTQEAAVFEVLRRMDAGEVPHGKAVVEALARWNADLDATGQRVDWLTRTLPGFKRLKGGTDLLTNYSLYTAFKRAAQLADPVTWKKAEILFGHENPGVMPTEGDIARAWITKQKWEYARTSDVAFIEDMAESGVREAIYGDEVASGPVVPDSSTGYEAEISTPSAALLDEATNVSLGLAGRFPVGSPAAQSLEQLVKMFKTIPREQRTAEWWADSGRAMLKFDSDGQVNWEKTARFGQREKVSPELAEKLNNAFDLLAEGAVGLTMYQRPDGSFGARIWRGGADFGEQIAAKLDMLEETGYVKPEKIAELRKMQPHMQQFLDQVEKEHAGWGELHKHAEATRLFKEAHEKWSMEVDRAYGHWNTSLLVNMFARLNGRMMDFLEPMRPVRKDVRLPVGEGKPNVTKGTAEAERALLGQATTEERQLRLMAGTKAYFDARADALGMGPEQKAMFSNVLMRTAAAFNDIGWGRLVELSNENVMGTYIGVAHRRWLAGVAKPGVFRELYGKDPWKLGVEVIHTLGHEFTHAVLSQKHELLQRSLEFKAFHDWAVSLGPEGRKDVLRHWWRIVRPLETVLDVKDREFFQEQAGLNVDEFIADLGSLYVSGIASPDKATSAAVREFGETALFSDVHQQNFMQMMFAPMSEMAEALNGYFQKWVPAMQGAVEPMSVHVDRMRSFLKGTSESIEAAMTKFNMMERFEPAMLDKLMAEGWLEGPVNADELMTSLNFVRSDMKLPSRFAQQALASAQKAFGLVDRSRQTELVGLQPNFYERNFMTSWYLAARYPILRPIIDIVGRFHSYVNNCAAQIGEPFMTTTDLLGRKVLDVEGKGLRYLFTHPKANKVSSMLGLIKGEMLEKPAMTDAEMRSFMDGQGLTDPTAQKHIINFHRACEAASPIMQKKIVELLQVRSARLMSYQLMLSHPGMKAESAKAVGDQLSAAVWADLQNPALRPGTDMLVAQLKSLYPKLDPAVGLLREKLSAVDVFNRETQNQPNFMSEARLGEYYAIWWDKAAGKHGAAAFDTIEELDAYEQKLRKREGLGEVSNIKTKARTDMQQEFAGLHPNLAKVWAHVEGEAYVKRLVMQGYDNAAIQAHRDMYTPGEAVLRQVDSRYAERLMRRREIAPGRETLNMAKGYIHHIEAVSRLLAMSVVDGDMKLALADPSMQGNPALARLAETHFNSVVHPSSKEFSFLKRLNFAMYMGFNFSSMAIEGTQPLLMLAPLLTRDSGSVGAGYKYMWKAAESLSNLVKTKSYGSAELDKVMKRAYDDQIIDFGSMQEFHDVESMLTANFMSLLHGGEGSMNPVIWGKTLMDAYAKTGRTIYSFAPRLNSIVSFLSTYRMAREHGVMKNGKVTKLGEAEAYEYAKQTTRMATLGGGTAARPIGMFGNKGNLQGLVGLMYSLGTYSFGMVSHLVRLGTESISKNTKLTVAEKKAARTALGQTLITQTALSGAMGLPFATATLALLEQCFPTLEASKTVEDTIRKMVGEDEEGGGMWSDIILRGIPYWKPGIDLSSRLAVSNLMGLSPYDGFSLKNLMGPTASVLANINQAVRKGVEGQWAEAGETLLPTAWKNVVKLWRDDWVMRDSAGRELLEPTPGELAWDMFGFRPRRLTDARNAVRMAQRGDEVWKRKNQLFHEEMAKRMMAGDTVGVQTALLDRQAEVDGYSAVAGARAVVDEVVDRTLPYDFAREGIRVNAAQRQLLATRAGMPQVSEVQRLVTKKTLARQLGIPGSGAMSPRELRQAEIIDQLMMTNPLLSRQEAAQLAAVLLGGRQPALEAPGIGAQLPFLGQ